MLVADLLGRARLDSTRRYSLASAADDRAPDAGELYEGERHLLTRRMTRLLRP